MSTRYIYDHNKLWFSHLDPSLRNVNEPFFYDDDFYFRRKTEEHYPVIKAELLKALDAGHVEIDADLNNKLSSGKDTWQSFTFFFWDHVVSEHNCLLVPQTLAVLRDLPGCTSALVSILNPNSFIHPHRVNTNGIYRCHLPLQVPAGLPTVGFSVGEEQRPWEEGKLLVFNDAAYHKAWNNSALPRVVLIFDIIRPEFMEHRDEICTKVANRFLEENKKTLGM